MAGDTSIVITSMLDIDGAALTMAGTFGTIGFGTLEPGNGALEEQISFTGLTNNSNGTTTLSGVSSVLFVYPYTQTSGLLKNHAGNVTFVISNTAGFYDSLLAKADDETITGLYTFPNGANTPVLGASYVAPTLQPQVASKGYVDSVAILGAPNATTSVQGLVQLPTQAQVDAGTATGSTGASLTPTPAVLRSRLLSDYKVDTGAANAYVITPAPAITAYAVGQIFTFKAAHTNTLTSTIAVNGLSAQTILKGDGTIVLAPGDIVAGQIVAIEYDGTNFQMISPVNVTPSGAVQMYVGASAPSGWLLCDGTSYLRTTYPTLFAVISTTYGSADGTHFNVPDFRGRVPIGVGTGTGGASSGTGAPTGGSALTAVALAGWKGEETHTLSTPEIPAHTHTLANVSQSPGSASGVYTDTAAITNANGIATGSSGGGSAHNNIQPTMGINLMIKI